MAGDPELAAGIPAGLSPGEGRKFGLTVGAAFLALAGLMWWRQHDTPRNLFSLVGGLLILLGVLAPSRLGPVYRVWMGFAHLLSKLTTPLFLGIVYYLVFTPTGLLVRLFGHRALEHGRGRPTSLWIGREPGSRRSDMERQF
jgi:hypothetical protein